MYFRIAHLRSSLHFVNFYQKRFLTYYRRHVQKAVNVDTFNGRSAFWIDLERSQRVYSGDNLNTRWLSGATGPIGNDQVNIAKCRLQLFDLVISDSLYEYALKKVMCPLLDRKADKPRKEMTFCDGEVSKIEHVSKKSDPLNGTDPLFIGAWLERLRPSFEIYDYARLMSWKQLKKRGVNDLPQLSQVPSYMETLAKYTNRTVSDLHFRKIERITLENEGYFHPPEEFCNRMKQIWTSNPDGELVADGVCD
jgi:hypothetical protein